MPRFDVTTLGEASLRMSVPVGSRLDDAQQLNLHVAGAEANVTGALAQLGHTCGWMSVLPDTPLGHRARNAYLPTGLDLSAVKWIQNGRMATLFVEYGAMPLPTRVFYDRRASSFATITEADIDWDYLLDSRLIHLTGITVALSDSLNDLIQAIVARAHSKGVPISFDVNHRSKLWDAETAQKRLEPLLQQVELLFCSRRDAENVFQLSGEPEALLNQLAARFQPKQIVMSHGPNGLYGWRGGEVSFIPAIPVEIVDRIGAGDAMAAGVIHGWLNGSFPQGLSNGVLAAACVMSQAGDMLITSPTEFDALLSGCNSRLER